MPKYQKITSGQTSPFLPAKIWPKRPIFYLIAYNAESLYAGNNINEELRNSKSNQNIQRVKPGQISPFLSRKIRPKIHKFYLIAYVVEFLYAGNNINKELRNTKCNKNVLW